MKTELTITGYFQCIWRIVITGNSAVWN